MTNKENLLNAIDKDANSETRKIAEKLSEDDAKRLIDTFEKDISNQKGATPSTTICELIRSDNNIAYKIKFVKYKKSSIAM